jgi:hypothetical protein
MFDEPLPPELRQVEQDVAALMRFNPQAETAGRIVGAMCRELRRERIAGRWKFVLWLAAGAFLWLHLSFYVASSTDIHFSDAPPAMPTGPSVPVALPAREFSAIECAGKASAAQPVCHGLCQCGRCLRPNDLGEPVPPKAGLPLYWE